MESFDPEGLMEQFVAAGAIILGARRPIMKLPQLNSTHHRWNAVEHGATKDIVSLAVARKSLGLPFACRNTWSHLQLV
jgi:alpha-L-fucosidase